MSLDNLKETIETLRERIQAHRAYLEGHETRTRQVLIDPMLRVLGWDIENPDSVQLEHTKTKKKWIDYVLMGSKGPIAVIEAKALRKPLDDEATDQVIIYAHRAKIPYMVVSDGDHWRMFASGDLTLMEFQLTQDEPYACALQALGMWRPNLASVQPKEAAKPALIEKLARAESSTDQPEPKPPESLSNEQQNQDNWVPLESFKIKDRKPPANTKIKFTESSIKPIKNWIDIWVSVARYLIETGKISEEDCPVCKTENATTYLLHTKSHNRNNVEFRNKEKIKDKDNKDLWLFTNFDPTNAYKTARWLLKKYGGSVNPSTVLISTNRS